MFDLKLTGLKTIVCIGCHADDIEIGCGAAMLRLIQHTPGLGVHWIVLGAQGQRAAEAKRSAQRFLQSAGPSTVEVRPFRDSYFPVQYAQVKDYLHELASRVDPDLVFTHRREDAHQDHRVAGELTWCTFRRHAILEYEIPKYEGDLGQPNVYLPVSAAAARRKLDLLEQGFATQRSKDWFTPQTFESLMRLRGVECRSPSGFAEAFHARKLVL